LPGAERSALPDGSEVFVIRLTRLSSQQITVNSDLIKFIESNPDTVITLLSGDKILVQETETEVVARVIEFKRAVVSGLLRVTDPDAAVSAASAQPDRNMLPHPEGNARG
jgi:flagellar protein FlbD